MLPRTLPAVRFLKVRLGHLVQTPACDYVVVVEHGINRRNLFFRAETPTGEMGERVYCLFHSQGEFFFLSFPGTDVNTLHSGQFLGYTKVVTYILALQAKCIRSDSTRGAPCDR